MTDFGTIMSFEADQGCGTIKPETGGDNLPFERSAYSWDIKADPPKIGKRVSYDVGTVIDSKPCALNLQSI